MLVKKKSCSTGTIMEINKLIYDTGKKLAQDEKNKLVSDFRNF